MTGRTHLRFSYAHNTALTIIGTVYVGGFVGNFGDTTVTPLLWIPLAGVGGVLSDIDKKRTTAHNIFVMILPMLIGFFTLSFISALVVLQSIRIAALSFSSVGVLLGLWLVLKICVHRRETHSLAFVMIMILLSITTGKLASGLHPWFGIIITNILLGIPLGVMSHIIADSFNIKKLHFFYPVELILGVMFKKRVQRRGKKYIQPVFILPNLAKIKTSSEGENLFRKSSPVAVIILGILTSAAVFYIR